MFQKGSKSKGPEVEEILARSKRREGAWSCSYRDILRRALSRS